MGVDETCGHQLVGPAVLVLAQVDRDDAAGPVRVVLRQPGLLDQTALRGQHQVLDRRVVADVQHLGDLLARLEREQVGHVLTLGVTTALGQLVRLGPVDATEVGEEQQPVVRRRDEEVVDQVVLAQLRAAHTLAAAPLRPVVVRARPLGVAAAGDGDDHLLLGDEVLDADLAVERQDRGATLVAVLGDDLRELLGHDVALALLAVEDRLVLEDLGLELGVVVEDLLTLQRGEPTQLHVEDRVGLKLVDVEHLHEADPRLVRVGRPADEGDDLVERVERLEVRRGRCGSPPRPRGA